MTGYKMANASIHVAKPLPNGGQRTPMWQRTIMRETYVEIGDSGFAHV
ncbi:MAG: hypothetical protein GY801_05510 [bacterium]|nr:hypothetical protein [bacterium]